MLGFNMRMVAGSGGAVDNIYRDEVLADSPVGYWRMTGIGSSFVDLGSGNRPLAGSGSGWSRAAGIISGGDGYSVLLDSTDASALTSSANHVEHRVTGDLSLEAWIRLSSLPAVSGEEYVVAMFGRSGSDAGSNINVLYWVAINNNAGAMRVRCFHENATGTNNVTTHDFAFEIDTTYHIVMVRDSVAKTNTVYVNGTLVSSVGYANNPTDGSSADCRFTIGAEQQAPGTFTLRFDGKIDEVALYSSKLSPARIAAHYAAGA